MKQTTASNLLLDISTLLSNRLLAQGKPDNEGNTSKVAKNHLKAG
jgi:hypothetical protein